MRFLATLGVVLVGALTGCRQVETPALRIDEFSGTNAFRHVEQLVQLGPRPSGTIAITQAAAYIARQLESYGLTVEKQEFQALSPRGPMQFRNVVARTRQQRGGAKSVIIIGSHFDTKHMPEIQMVGANDSGSSSGALLELARVAASAPDLVFAFFDGEEAIEAYGPEDGLWGSKFFVGDLKGSGQIKRIKAMVLLDMVGDADLTITIPATGTSELAQQVFTAARALGYRDHFGFRPIEILDDHVPFLQAGIPAVNIIDFEYGSASGKNDYWHTDQDTLDKISPKSLEIVGRTVIQLLNTLRRESAGGR